MPEQPHNSAQRTERIGKYEILGHIATGGMGIVYKARDIDLDRLVALKILPPELAKQTTTLVRFKREAKAAALLRHENIVTIYDVGEEEGTHFIAFEFIEGTDLQFYISRKCRLDPEETRQIMIQAARALNHAHEHKVVHRDIKPSNFLLMRKDNKVTVKLSDFGLAIRHENDADFRVTRDKTTVGTIDYMAPEQARDSRLADIRSDIYSLGCTAYHMLSGMAPFARGTLPERIVQHMKVSPPDLRKLNKSIPDYLVAIINRMLAKKPKDRYQSPADLLFDLEHPEKMATHAKGDKNGKAKPTKKNDEPTAVVANEEIEKSADDRPQVKAKPARKAESAARTEHADDWVESATQESGRKANRGRKKADNSALWTYGVATTVAVLAIALVTVMVVSSRQAPKKEPEKPPVPTPFVKIEWKPDPTPVVDSSPENTTVVAPVLPIMDTSPEKVDAAALRTKFAGSFVAFPTEPNGAKVLRVSRLPDAAPGWHRTLEEALAKVQDDFTVIEIVDNGPLFVPALPTASNRSILIRGADGYRPLLVWNPPKKALDGKAPLVFASLTQGKMILENLDFVFQTGSPTPVVVFDLPASDFAARNCTFSLAGKSVPSITLVRRLEAKNNSKSQTWFKRCYVRGPDVTLLDMNGASTALLVDESLIASQNQPVLRIRARDDDAVELRALRSTLISGQSLVSWNSHDGKRGLPVIDGWVLDSILSCDNPSTAGDMIDLKDDADAAKMQWHVANSVYSGWKNLLASASKSIAAHDLAGWRRQWVYADGDRALADAWPGSPPTGLEDQAAEVFLPANSPVAFAAVTGPGAVGCVAGWLPGAPNGWQERLFEPRAVASLPAADIDPPAIPINTGGLYHGERLDLNKIDLGAYLTAALQKKTPGPRVVLHLTGKGLCSTSPMRLKGVNLVLYSDPKEPLVLEVNPANLNYAAAAIELNGGSLELIGVRLRVSPNTFMPALVHVTDGDLTASRCTLLGPIYKPAESFQSLFLVGNTGATPTTALLRDNVLMSGKGIIHLQDQVQLRARNNVAASLGSAIVFDANRPTVAMTHVLDHNTIAARNAALTLRTGPEFRAAGPVLLHASSNAFLTPFADSSDQRAVVRGAGNWVRSGRWNWQGRYNVYDNRLHTFLTPTGRSVAGKQVLRDWQSMWGPAAEFEATPLDVGPLVKAIVADAPAISNLPTMLDRFALPRTIRGDPEQAPPGADLWELGLLKKKN